MKNSKFSQFISHVISTEASKTMKGGNAYFCTHRDGSEGIYAGYDDPVELTADYPEIQSCEEMSLQQ